MVHNRYRSSSPGGEDRVVDQEVAALSSAHHDVERFERSSDEIAQRNLLGKALVSAEVVWSKQAQRSLAETLRGFRPDVVHVHNTFPLLSASVLYACRSEQVPVVATLHNYRLACASGDFFRNGTVCRDCVGRAPLPAIRHRCYRDSMLATIPLAAAVAGHRRAWRTMVAAYIFLSAAQRDMFIGDGFPLERLFVKPNFVPDMPEHQRRDGATEDIAVYAGRLTEAKGVDLLMEAWDRYSLVAPGSRLRLILAGAGPLEHQVAIWAAARPTVDWVGMLSRPACAGLLARARAAIVPSRWAETFGLVAIEAMAAGVPPIAAAHGSFPELITDGDDGVLFEPGNASALSSVLRDVEENPARYEELGTAARRTYEERFASGPNVKRLVEIYQFAIEHPVH